MKEKKVWTPRNFELIYEMRNSPIYRVSIKIVLEIHLIGHESK